MADVYECICGNRAGTVYLTPDGMKPWSEKCVLCRNKLKKVGTTPRRIKTEMIVQKKAIALEVR